MGQDMSRTMRPDKIRYGKIYVRDRMKNGRDLIDVFEDLVKGKLEPSDMTPIKVVEHFGNYYATDNESNQKLLLFKVRNPRYFCYSHCYYP